MDIETALHRIENAVADSKRVAWGRWGRGFIYYVKGNILGRKIVDKDKISKAFKLTAQYISMWCNSSEDREWYKERLTHTVNILKNKKAEIIRSPGGGYLTGYRKTSKGKPIPPDQIMLFGVLYRHLVYFIGNERQASVELQELFTAMNPDNVRAGDIKKNLERSPYRHNYLSEYYFWIGHFLGYHVASAGPVYFHSGIKVKYIKASKESRRQYIRWYEQIKEDFRDFEEWYLTECSQTVAKM